MDFARARMRTRRSEIARGVGGSSVGASGKVSVGGLGGVERVWVWKE